MPLATRPNQTYEIVLSTDADLPKDKQPVFIFRYVSIEEWEEIASLDTAFDVATDPKIMIDLAFRAIKKTLCDWRNMKKVSGEVIPYKPEKLKTMVTLQEAVELMQAAVAQKPALEDKKKLDLPSDSGTAESVKDAKGPASAETNQQ